MKELWRLGEMTMTGKVATWFGILSCRRTLRAIHFGPVVSPYVSPFVRNNRLLDMVYGMKSKEDETFMIWDSPVTLNVHSYVSYEG